MKVLSISEVEQQDAREPIWALNTSAQSEAGQAGEILVGIPKQNGSKVDPLLVPQTWLPQELTAQIPRAQLLASAEFRSSINKNLLTLIPEKEALKLLQQEGATEERQRLVELAQVVRRAGAARTIGSSKAEIRMVTVGAEDDDETATEEVTSNEEGSKVSPNFAMFVESISHKDDVHALNDIRSRRRFKKAELEYIVANLTDKPKTLKAVKAQLDKLSS